MPAKLKIFLERGYVICLNNDKNKSISYKCHWRTYYLLKETRISIRTLNRAVKELVEKTKKGASAFESTSKEVLRQYFGKRSPLELHRDKLGN